MKMPPCPPDCPNRCAEPNCHMTCKTYLDWRSDKDRENAVMYAEHSEVEYAIKAQDRMRRLRYHGKQR